MRGLPPSLPAGQARMSKRRQRSGHKRLLNGEMLDGRTAAAKAFDSLVAAICSDLGGCDRLSAIQERLIQCFAGSSVVIDSLNAQILTGAEINGEMIAMHAKTASALVRVSKLLGIERRARDVPSMIEYARACGILIERPMKDLEETDNEELVQDADSDDDV